MSEKTIDKSEIPKKEMDKSCKRSNKYNVREILSLPQLDPKYNLLHEKITELQSIENEFQKVDIDHGNIINDITEWLEYCDLKYQSEYPEIETIIVIDGKNFNREELQDILTKKYRDKIQTIEKEINEIMKEIYMKFSLKNVVKKHRKHIEEVKSKCFNEN